MFTAPEVEFLAEDEIVEIIPNVRMGALHMICGDFGPFLPQIAVKVPLWLAVAMKKRGKCAIRPPGWLSVDNLTQVLEAERESPREFQAARDDIQTYIWSLIEDIKGVRFHKVETGLETISGRTHAVKLILYAILVRTLQAFYKHDSPQIVQPQGSLNSKRPQAADRGPRRDLRPR
ncbi:unnamed protein product [Spirodela intermedia]|uniref:DNA replication complex GINS protein PSF2 N-terminal domain-containing protein n=1 Tax=Spirodela intermedia TaxID=51605 RepID=A0A7I8IBN9_SPIIN|nr:unnamed protein product [Spirodela intermedia]CAA6654980.1 unnamed protein product [Spirodela intermedia]